MTFGEIITEAWNLLTEETFVPTTESWLTMEFTDEIETDYSWED